MTQPPPACPRTFIPEGGAEPCACDLAGDGHRLCHCPACGEWWSLASETAASPAP